MVTVQSVGLKSYMHAYYEHQYMYFLVPPSPEEYVDWNNGRAQVPDCSQNPLSSPMHDVAACMIKSQGRSATALVLKSEVKHDHA